MLLPSNVPPTMQVVTSPFLRCRQTAEGFADAGFGTRIVVDRQLSEVFGPIRIKVDTAPTLTDDGKRLQVSALPAWGETLLAAHSRFRRMLTKYAQEELQSVLLVVHGDFMDAALRFALPGNFVYSCQYLGMIILKRSLAPVVEGYQLVAHDGVEWAPESDAQVNSGKETNIVPVDFDVEVDNASDSADQMVSYPLCTRKSDRMTALRVVAVVSQVGIVLAWDEKGLALSFFVAVVAVELVAVQFLQRGPRWCRDMLAVPVVSGFFKLAVSLILYAFLGTVIVQVSHAKNLSALGFWGSSLWHAATLLILVTYQIIDAVRVYFDMRRVR